MPGPGESVKPAPKEHLYKLPDKVTPEEIAAFDEDDPVDPEAVLRWLETGEADPWGESSSVDILTVATRPPVPVEPE